MSAPPFLQPVQWLGRPVEIETEWLQPERVDCPLIVFLHEGLGSLAQWRDFPRPWLAS